MTTRKISILLISTLIFCFIIGCSKSEPAEQGMAEGAEEGGNTSEPVFNPCNNIFYPLALNNQWIYEFNYEDPSSGTTTSQLGLTVSEVSDSSAVLAALDYDTGIVTQSTVECQDGAIMNFPMTELNMVFGDVAGDLQLQYMNGLFMPSENDFSSGNWLNNWDTEFAATGSIAGSYESDSFTAELSSSPVKMKWQVISIGETLQVLAGSFSDVVKINREVSIDVTSLKGNFEGTEVNLATTLTINSDMWYAPGIGLIKQELSSASIKLYGVSFPIDTWGNVELKSYTIQ